MSEPINGERLWKQLQALCERHGLGKPIHVPDFEERVSKALACMPSATGSIAPAEAYVLAIQQSVGSILSQYAANKILDRAKDIANGN